MPLQPEFVGRLTVFLPDGQVQVYDERPDQKSITVLVDYNLQKVQVNNNQNGTAVTYCRIPFSYEQRIPINR